MTERNWPDPNESWMLGTPTGPNVSWVTPPEPARPMPWEEQKPQKAEKYPWVCGCNAVGVNCDHPDPRADSVPVGTREALTAALKVISGWQAQRDHLKHTNAVLSSDAIRLFFATLDIHAEILTEALAGHTDPELALKLAAAITRPKEEFEKEA